MGNYNSGTPQFFNQAMLDNTPMPTPQRRGSKMPLIIGGVVVFVILSIVIIILAIGGTPVSKETTVSEFKTFVNFIVNNKNDGVIDTSVDPSGSIEITRRAQNYSQNASYFKDVEDKAKKVIDSVKRSSLSKEDKENLTNYAYSVIAYSKLSEFNTYKDGLIEQYMRDQNYDKTLNSISDHYKDLTESGNDNIKSGAEQLISANKLYLRIVNELSVNKKDVRDFQNVFEEFYTEDQIYSYNIQIDRAYNSGKKSINTEFNAQTAKSWEYVQKLENKQWENAAYSH